MVSKTVAAAISIGTVVTFYGRPGRVIERDTRYPDAWFVALKYGRERATSYSILRADLIVGKK